jgi:hypothetical protein
MRNAIDMAREAGVFMLMTESVKGQSDWWKCFDEAIEKLVALVRADERAEMRKGFAGVTLWIDSAYVTQIVTELEIQYERVPGTALKHAAEKCLAVYAGAREAK